MEKNKISTYIYNAIVILCIAAGAFYAASQFMYFGGGEVTDNARVCQNIVPQNTRVCGYIKEARFEEFQEVKKGDTLVILEQAEYLSNIDMANAGVEDVDAGSSSTEAAIDRMNETIGRMQAGLDKTVLNSEILDANIAEMEIKIEKLRKDKERYEALVQRESATPVQLENIQTELNATEKKLLALKKQKEVSSSGIIEANAGVKEANAGMRETATRRNSINAGKKRAKASLELARIGLSYCYIIATCDGVTGKKNIQEGQMVNPGQTLVSIVDSSEKWVEANYQESQMPHIKVGDKVSFTADAVPDVEYTGVVERISDATGSAFSLIPVDNATGNFVKVEQRVTVRVKLDVHDQLDKLHGGYNVICKVEE